MWIHFSLSIYRRRDEVVKTDEFFPQDTRLLCNLGSSASVQTSLKALMKNGLVTKHNGK